MNEVNSLFFSFVIFPYFLLLYPTPLYRILRGIVGMLFSMNELCHIHFPYIFPTLPLFIACILLIISYLFVATDTPIIMDTDENLDLDFYLNTSGKDLTEEEITIEKRKSAYRSDKKIFFARLDDLDEDIDPSEYETLWEDAILSSSCLTLTDRYGNELLSIDHDGNVVRGKDVFGFLGRSKVFTDGVQSSCVWEPSHSARKVATALLG